MARTLLIVDDIKTNRETLKAILGKDFSIIEADNGQEALEVLGAARSQISAVLLALGTPVMDGYEVLECMKESEPLSQIPVIVTTGSTEAEAEERALRLGAKDFIGKPYQSGVIRQRVWNIINLRETAAAVNAMRKDRLTGLFGRDSFFSEVRERVAAHPAGYYIMACFDVGKFKVINDLYGTEKGDEALRHIARVFQTGFEKNGGVCCRVAADNFAVLYPAALQNSFELASMRRDACLIPGLAAPLVFSIGRYVVSDPSMPPSAMYDRAMLAANSIKGRYDTKIALYDESMRENMLQEQRIVTEMDSALARRQFEIWYQPQYNHATGAMIGAEALVRWRRSEGGLIPPSAFIPVFEQNGFIYELDKYVWDAACQYLKSELDAKATPLPVSVNISRYDVFRPDFVAFITGLVAQYNIPVDLLRLEITESAFSESTEHIVSVVKKLIQFGFTVEIDDFGSGFSSLNTLKSVPAQVIKLDMRFFEDNDDDRRGGSIIESVVRMSKWLGMSVIAEGVESPAQADYLLSIGCSYIQGFLYAKPMPEDSYRSLCRGAEKEEKLITLETVQNLDNNTFWDPKSMDTLIFNSYVGAACIFEYHQGKIELLRATEKYAQVIGGPSMTVEEALALDWSDHLDSDSYQLTLFNLDKSVDTKKEVTDEYIFLNLPNCPYETHLRSTMRVIATAGNRYLVYCTNENITAQRLAERRERQTAEQLKSIMANMNGGIGAFTVEADGRITTIFANDQYYALTGYTKEQALAEVRDPYAVIYPEDHIIVRRALGKLLQTRRPCEYVYRCIKRDGTVIYVRTNASASSLDGYSDNAIISIQTDITEQIQSEQRIRTLSDQMQAIMDNVDLGIIAAVVADEDARYVFANDHYYSMLGYTRAQFESEIHTPYQTVAPEDNDRVVRETSRLNQTGGSIMLEYRALRRDGQGRYIGLPSPWADCPASTRPCSFPLFGILPKRRPQNKLFRNPTSSSASSRKCPISFWLRRIRKSALTRPSMK